MVPVLAMHIMDADVIFVKKLREITCASTAKNFHKIHYSRVVWSSSSAGLISQMTSVQIRSLLPIKPEITGSNPACNAVRGSSSSPVEHRHNLGWMDKLVRRWFANPEIVGSNPILSSIGGYA